MNQPEETTGNLDALSDNDAPLRDDVRLLGQLLGETLISQRGHDLFDRVEKVRALSKAARAGDTRSADELSALLSTLSADEMLDLARAFSHFLNLANIAEQHHQIRQRRIADSNALKKELKRLRSIDVTDDQLYDAVCGLNIGLVLTAHPTEIARRTLTLKYKKISDLLAFRDRNDLTEAEKSETIEGLKRKIVAIWETDEIRRERPTPPDEVRSGLVIVEQSLWEAIPKFLRQLDMELKNHTGKSLPLAAAPIRVGSWMGGDRDGNPNVTPAVTRRACLMARWQAADLYWREVDELRRDLSMHRCDDALRQLAGDAHEPYRKVLRALRNRLAGTRRELEEQLNGKTKAEDLIESIEEIRQPLLVCYRSLHNTGAGDIAQGRLLDLIRRTHCFGLGLVRLDIRQEAARHTQTLSEITQYLELGDYAEWNEEQRLSFLIHELQNKRPLIPHDIVLSAEPQEVLDTFYMLAGENPECLGAYVISMATYASDVLAVELLQRECGVKQPLRVVPLFERVDDLKGAAHAFKKLLAIDWYRKRINGHQEIMIGYSDSAKDAGQIAAAWGLYRGQESLTDVAQQHDVKLTLFHGRGGTVARGGGPARAAIRSLPPGSVNGAMRVTEQGEVIQAKFALPNMALGTLTTYATAVLEASLTPPPKPEKAWRDAMEVLSETSMQSYRGVVQQDADFLDYFHTATPESELGKLKIGSRPARRKPGRDVAHLRAIPWIFAWTQTRLMLPAWLGVGKALRSVMESGGAEDLKQMKQRWPFFAATLDSIEMVIAKTDPNVVARYDARLVPENLHALGAELRARFGRTAEAVLMVTGHEQPLEHEPVTLRSISVRNPYTDPLNLLQIELLARLRAGETGVIEDALLVAINGIAAGMRNTG